ncbi:MAG: hypothetical protein AAF830_05870 [Pseudomonadota bacterium]
MTRRPLEEMLADEPELAQAQSLDEAEERLRALFSAAQGQANAYAAERLQEVYDVADRALALSSAFPPPAPVVPGSAGSPWWRRAQDLVGRYGAGLLLAACAPLVADSSVTLAIASGIAAALTLLAARKPADTPPPTKRPEPRAIKRRIESLLSAADRSLSSMTAPQALEAPRSGKQAFQEDDVLQVLQDMMALGRHTDDNEVQALAENAQRLVDRAGFRPVWEGDGDLFEVMIDPAVREPILLKPALVHKADRTRTVFGVLVRS